MNKTETAVDELLKLGDSKSLYKAWVKKYNKDSIFLRDIYDLLVKMKQYILSNKVFEVLRACVIKESKRRKKDVKQIDVHLTADK
jgi:hypothetical protein